MIAIGPCRECGQQLAGDQRYCLSCGTRVAAQPPIQAKPLAIETPAKKPLIPLPPQTATTLAAAALGFGVVIGTALTPGLDKIVAQQSLQPPVIAAPTPPAAPPSTATPPAVPGAPLPPSSGIASTALPSTSSVPTVGTGGKKKKKKKPKSNAAYYTGTVVHVNTAAGSYALADPAGGPLNPIHADVMPKPGARIKVPTRTLANGTLAQQGKIQNKGQQTSANFSGTVTFRDTSTGLYTVSSRGYSALVHLPLDGATGRPAGEPPPLGASVKVGVTISPSLPAASPPATPPPPAPTSNPPTACENAAGQWNPIAPPAALQQTAVTVVSTAPGGSDLEGVVRATCPDTRQLAISADDAQESGMGIVLTVPAAIDMSKIVVGSSYGFTATISAAPPFALTGLISDQGTAGANDTTSGQGDRAVAQQNQL